jgi:hypothetical protein
MWGHALRHTDPASIAAALLGFHPDKVIDAERGDCASRIGNADPGDPHAGVEARQVSGGGKPEGRNSENNPHRRERKLAFHVLASRFALITLAFSPNHRMSLTLGKFPLHCNIARAAKSDACCRMPLPASAALD